ncbi:NAD(P)H-binding protein, partial [Acinetobacter baumannii]
AGLGIDVVAGDLHDRHTLAAALADVETAYFAYPVAAGIVDAAANFAAAGRAAGLKRVVVMSMGVSRPDSPSHLGRAQYLAEEMLEWAGFGCLHL